MPFLAAGALLGGGLAAGGALGATTLAAGALAGAGVGGLLQGYSDNKKAQGAAADAAARAKIDIGALDAQTRAIAKQNALDSAALEQQLTPEVPQLRTAANNAVLNNIGGTPAQQASINFLMSRFGQPVSDASFQMNTPLLNDAIAKARADLALGGKLSLDQRNEATRRGAATAGSVAGGTGLGLGRDLSARDLGLTSYNVEQQRLQNAQGFGGLELGQNQLGLGAANFNLQRDIANNSNYLNQFSLLNSYYNNLRNQDLAAAAYGQSIRQPLTGLDPSSIANIAIGNSNAQTQAGLNAAGIQAQNGNNLMNFGGQLVGYGLLGGFNGAGAGGSNGFQTFGNGYSVPTGSSFAPRI